MNHLHIGKKKIVLTLFFIGILYNSIAFAGDPPEIVTAAFKEKFPGAEKVKWDKENQHEYEAAFMWNGIKYSANFSDKGAWLETESPVAVQELPTAVQINFTQQHPQIKEYHVSKIEFANGTMKFEFECKKGLQTIEYFYLTDGTATIE